jgi:hypothetical protein
MSDALRQAADKAIEALAMGAKHCAAEHYNAIIQAQTDLRAALAQPKAQKPFAWVFPALPPRYRNPILQMGAESPRPFTPEEAKQQGWVPVYAEQPKTQNGWRPVADEKPPEGHAVWLLEKDSDRVWIGSFEFEDDGWHFTRSYSTPTRTDGVWDFDAEWDDDYNPTHWMPLPGTLT